jgi:hypothetical protein
VVSARARVEVHVVGAVEEVEAILRVLGGVRVDDVHQHVHAQPVGLVDHRLMGYVEEGKRKKRGKEAG